MSTLTPEEACDFTFPPDQGKNYAKEEFLLHSRLAEVVGDVLGRVFYNDDTSSWEITATQLKELVLMNILQEGDEDSAALYSKYPIYGSAVAFEPNVWGDAEGLSSGGVTYPAASLACWEDNSYCTEKANDCLVNETNCLPKIVEVGSENNLHVTKLNTNDVGETIYCPYAFRGPPDESVYGKCSRDSPQFCPSMELSFAYDYSNMSVVEAEWYAAPRCLYLRDGISQGYWTNPYFDAGAGRINMTTYSQPIISQSGKFLEIATIDVTVDALCYGDQCGAPPPIDYHYLTAIRPVGMALFVIAALASIACAIWTHVYRNNRITKASQPFFLGLICMGCLIMSSAIIPLSIDDSIASTHGCNVACMSYPWLLSIGFTTIFSALFSKIWRLNQIIRHAVSMRRVVIKEKDVMLPFMLLMTINVALLLGWTLVDPMVWHRTEPENYESHGYCEPVGNAYIGFLVPIGLVNGLVLVLANVQAFRARSITTEFSESQYVFMTLVSLLQALVIGIPLMVITHDTPVASYFVWVGIIFVMVNAILGLMFVPKMAMLREREKEMARAKGSGTENGTSLPPRYSSQASGGGNIMTPSTTQPRDPGPCETNVLTEN